MALDTCGYIFEQIAYFNVLDLVALKSELGNKEFEMKKNRKSRSDTFLPIIHRCNLRKDGKKTCNIWSVKKKKKIFFIKKIV